MEPHQAMQLVQENLKTIYAYAYARVSNRSDAEDLAGDIVLAILVSAPKLREDRAFFGFIWSIAANTYKTFLRRKAARTHLPLNAGAADDCGDPAAALCDADDLNRLRRELSLLSREHRECVIAYYFDGLSCADTARKLHLSLDMVKYCLFTIRKNLKEGILMEREFGVKSYKPAEFQFMTIFSGQFNREYCHLFNRRLPGNILVSAYYTPMTVRELSIELGVASVYLEDEIDLLVKYGLLTKLPHGKYQTRLVIFTEEYTREFYQAAEKECTALVARMLAGIRGKLPLVRTIGFKGAEYSDEHLLWAFLFDLMREGHRIFEQTHPKSDRTTELYNGATGTCYGIDYLETPDLYSSNTFAGYSEIDDTHFAIFADFGVFPENQRYAKACDWSHAPVLTPSEKERMEALLSDEIQQFAELYSRLSRCAEEIMRVHAPSGVESMVQAIIEQTIFFRTVGLIGVLAVRSGEVSVPEDERVKPVLVCDSGEEAYASDAGTDRMVTP